MPKLAGVNTYPAAGSNLTQGFICVSQFTASASGLLTELHVLMTNVNGVDNVTGCVYADAAGLPGAFLGQTLSAPAPLTQVYTLFLTAPVKVVSGTLIWLGGITQNVISMSDNQVSGNNASIFYKAQTYGAAFPDPYGSATGSIASTWIDIQGWTTQQSWNNFENAKVGASGMSVTEVVR